MNTSVNSDEIHVMLLTLTIWCSLQKIFEVLENLNQFTVNDLSQNQ